MSQAGVEMPGGIRKFNILCNCGGAGAQLRLTNGRSGRIKGEGEHKVILPLIAVESAVKLQ